MTHGPSPCLLVVNSFCATHFYFGCHDKTRPERQTRAVRCQDERRPHRASQRSGQGLWRGCGWVQGYQGSWVLGLAHVEYWKMTTPIRPPARTTRTVSATSAVSHMDLQIKHHWNDALAPRSLVSRPASPAPPATDEQIRQSISSITGSSSRLSDSQKKTHIDRLDSLNLQSLSQEQKDDLLDALKGVTPEHKRKALVEFIRNNDGVIRWAASLRSLAESMI